MTTASSSPYRKGRSSPRPLGTAGASIEVAMTMKRQTETAKSPGIAPLILDVLTGGVFTVDTRGRITSWNRAMERITGYSDRDVLGRSSRIIGFAPSRPSGSKARELKQECCLKHRNGMPVPVQRTTRTLKDRQDKIIGQVEMVTDISELESIRRRSDQVHLLLGDRHRFGRLIGASHDMKRMYTTIQALAACDIPVLIQGEAGTGKTLVAQAIHEESRRKHLPFLVCACGVLPEQVLARELFGLAGDRGGCNRRGLLEKARGGTVYLQDIDTLSPYIQMKLLSTLQTGETCREGDRKTTAHDVRILTGIRTDLSQLASQGLFRQDLALALSVCRLTVPPLRQRKNDIPDLVEHFMALPASQKNRPPVQISHDAMRALLDYSWPGNVRELESVLEQAALVCRDQLIDFLDLPLLIRNQAADNTWPGSPKGRKRLQPETLSSVLGECGWNKAEAGRRLGLSRASIWKYMKKWNIPLEKPLCHS